MIVSDMRDVIAASASAPLESAIAVVRIAGDGAVEVFRKVFTPYGKTAPNMLCLGEARDSQGLIDRAMGVYFRAPRSYTGQDAAEIQLHGGAYTVKRALDALYKAGARPAEPGEFTKRAFLNGKIDLSRAEAVMDIISAEDRAAQRIAADALSGRVFGNIQSMQNELTGMLAQIEANADYPEEDLEEHTAQLCIEALKALALSMDEMLSRAEGGRVLRSGASIAIIGVPNAGKSSLLNALCGRQRAIVSTVAGTTRDTLDIKISINGLAVRLVDTAGIRSGADELEEMGIQRAKQAISEADMALVVIDGASGVRAEDEEIIRLAEGMPMVLVYNKSDIAAPDMSMAEQRGIEALAVSAKTGEGIEELANSLYARVTHGVAVGDVELANTRHIEAVREARGLLDSALTGLADGFPPDVAAVDIRACWRKLGAVTGNCADESIIDEIFSRFCLGK